ncbi:MAG: GAF domain-containing protein, partial [Anaerolineales bacterium]|nr:GAF domain-containing protein [Anaerolineales bacterium]
MTLPLHSQSDTLRAWRLNALSWILRGQIAFWLLAFFAGTWNAIQSYREEASKTPHAAEALAVVVTLYFLVAASMALITFWRKLGYALRVSIMLGVYYFVGVLQFNLSALSGDSRVFLFAFAVLAAVFLDMPYNFLAQALALFTFALMGWLNVSGVINIPDERELNASDPSAWISGGIVFTLLSVSISLAVSYLLRSFSNNLKKIDGALQNEQRAAASLRLLSDVNQLIVREHNAQRLFDEVCRMIVNGGYAYAWAGRLQNASDTLDVLARAGAPIASADIDLTRAECALKALRSRECMLISSQASKDICRSCAMLSILPKRAALALPIQREKRLFGVLVVARDSADTLSEEETRLLQELADDLAYALENIETETQRRALAESAASLLTAQDENSFWPLTLDSVRAILRADRAAIYIYNHGLDRISCPYSSGLSQEYVEEINSRFREIPGSCVLQNAQPLSVNDSNTDPFVAPLRLLMRREGIRSYAIFPLFSAQKLMGAFVAYRNNLIPFTQPDMEAGQTLAHLVATSLQNARLFAETRVKAAEQAALYAAAQDMASSLLNPPALLNTFATHLATVLDATSVYILALDSEGENFTVLAEYWSESASAMERKPDLGRVYPAIDYPGLLRFLRFRKVFLSNVDDSGLNEYERGEFFEYGIQTKLFIPLVAQNRLVGHAEIWESRRRREFTQNEINLAQALAYYAANVIHTTDLFAELERSYDATLSGWARALELRDKETEDHTR